MLRQPIVIGYLISGIIVGPYALNILQSNDQVELFSQIGISVLLFIVGLSLNPDTIKDTGKSSLITGIGQIVFTSVFGFMIMKALGYSDIISLYSSIALTFSSTIIILKLLSDRGDLGTLYGKISIGFLLVQDVVATILLIIVPLVGAHNSTNGNLGGQFVKLFSSGVLISILLYLISKYILPKFSDYLAKSSELLFIFSVSWGLVLATLFYKIGFSIEIGALIAGVTLSASKYAYEISSRMRPLRDFFIVMFFVLLGSHLAFGNIQSLIIPAVILSLFVLIGNPLIVFILMNLLGYKNKTSFMAGLTVAQISEFSLILISLGYSLGHLDQASVTLITFVGIITIAGSTYFVIYANEIFYFLSKILQKIAIRKKLKDIELEDDSAHEMLIFGFGRVGSEFVEKATEKKISYLAVDYDPEVFQNEKIDREHYRFGDVEDLEFLEEIKLKEAKIVISTIPDLHTNILLTRFYRAENKTGTMIIVCHTAKDAETLYSEGVTYVILPHYLGAYHAVKMLSEMETNQNVFDEAKKVQKKQISKHS